MNHLAAFELLPLYSLDAVDPDDRRAIDVHVASCQACQGELSRYARVVVALSGELEPSAHLWSRILDRIGAD